MKIRWGSVFAVVGMGGVVFAFVKLSAYRKDLDQMIGDGNLPPRSETPPLSRPHVRPSGTLTLRVARIPLPQLEVVSMTENQKFLFRSKEKETEYEVYFHDQVRHTEDKTMATRCFLAPNGSEVHSAYEPSSNGMSASVFPYDESVSEPKFFSDGTIATVRKIVYQRKISPGIARPGSAVNRDMQAEVTRPTHLAKSPANFNDKLDYFSVVREKHFVRNSEGKPAGVVSGLDELYRTNNVASVLAVGPSDEVWLREHHGPVLSGKDVLVRISKATTEAVPLPKGYVNIHRVTQSKGSLAATFGVVGGRLPFRSFVRQNHDWKELALPEGYDASFVQKIFANGMILGFITTWDGTKIEHVVWKGDDLGFLDESPAWPKRGALSLVYRATCSGVIAVKNITDPVSNNGEYYLISVK